MIMYMKNPNTSTKTIRSFLAILLLSSFLYFLPNTISARDHMNDNSKNWMHFNLGDVQNKDGTQVIAQKLHILLKQHAVVGGIAFVKLYDQNPDFERLNEEVKKNTQALTETIGYLYGEEKKDDFKELWEKHIQLLTDHTIATREQNQSKKQETINNLQIVTDQLSLFFASNGHIPKEEIAGVLKIHIDQEKAIIDNAGAHNQNEIVSLLIQAGNHADMMADMVLKNK